MGQEGNERWSNASIERTGSLWFLETWEKGRALCRRKPDTGPGNRAECMFAWTCPPMPISSVSPGVSTFSFCSFTKNFCSISRECDGGVHESLPPAY